MRRYVKIVSMVIRSDYDTPVITRLVEEHCNRWPKTKVTWMTSSGSAYATVFAVLEWTTKAPSPKKKPKRRRA